MHKDLIPDIKKITKSVNIALEEDIGLGDITGELIDSNLSINASLICREETILCGKAWFEESFVQLDPKVSVIWNHKEGDLMSKDTEVATLNGNARCLVASERTGLNFLQMMSGIAYKTYVYVNELSGSNTMLLDTRKTLPGLRYEQKYSVKIGGGENHRMGLFDAALVKENHIESAGSIDQAVKSIFYLKIKFIEVEVENLEQLKEAITSGADIAMLDNFEDDDLKIATEVAKNKIKLEVSGNITLERVHKLKSLNIDYISSGDLTKNISATDYSLIFKTID